MPTMQWHDERKHTPAYVTWCVCMVGGGVTFFLVVGCSGLCISGERSGRCVSRLWRGWKWCPKIWMEELMTGVVHDDLGVVVSIIFFNSEVFLLLFFLIFQFVILFFCKDFIVVMFFDLYCVYEVCD